MSQSDSKLPLAAVDVIQQELALYRAEVLAPIVALARKQLETGSAVSGGTSLAIKILELAGEK